MSKLYINKYVRLQDNAVFINGEKVFSVDSSDSFSSFAKAVYKGNGLNYSKFYKMDVLSKLGFLAAELVLKDIDRKNVLPEDIAIILANNSSSIHTDSAYQKTISNIASPAVFVYTLPNIVIGEICIKNEIKGESLFFIQEEFDTKFISEYVCDHMNNTSTKMCITGWVEITEDENYKADFYLVTKNISDIEFDENNLNITYRS